MTIFQGNRHRKWLGLGVVAGVMLLFGAVYVTLSGQSMPGVTAAQAGGEKEGKTVDIKKLMETGPLPENVLGKPDAPVTIIEYSSMTCPHCASFHVNTLPALKKKYIDTGKVRYIIREFPLDNLAAAAFMLARCAGPEKYFPFVDAMYAQQKSWAFVEGNPVPALLKMAKQAGFTKESFNKCLMDQKLLDGIMWVRARGAREFGVNSTPTFFVNGKMLRGAADLAAFEKLMPKDVVQAN